MHRGEIAATIDGEERTLCLTLGALAELEARFASSDLVALAERFQTGRMKSDDLIAVIGAGLRGGGLDITDDAVSRLPIDGGAPASVRIVSELLTATFGGTG